MSKPLCRWLIEFKGNHDSMNPHINKIRVVSRAFYEGDQKGKDGAFLDVIKMAHKKGYGPESIVKKKITKEPVLEFKS